MAVAIVLKGSFFFFAVLFSVRNNTAENKLEKDDSIFNIEFFKIQWKGFWFSKWDRRQIWLLGLGLAGGTGFLVLIS